MDYPNVPPEQRALQRQVDEFNGAEALWRKLAARRRLRRSLRPDLSEEEQRQRDLREFEHARPPVVYKGRALPD